MSTSWPSAVDVSASLLQWSHSNSVVYYRYGGSDTLMNEMEDKAYNLIEEIMLNNYQWSNERSQPKRIGGKLELNAIFMLSAKVDAMS